MWQRKWWVQCWWVNRGSGSNMDESSPPSHTQGRKKERKKKKSQFHWRISLMKPEKVWHTKSQPRVFLTPQDEMGRLHTAPALHPKYDTVFGKSECVFVRVASPTGPSVHKARFLLERETGKLWLLTSEYVTNIFLKMNKISLSLRGKWNNETQAFKINLVLENLLSGTLSLTASQYLEDFSNEISCDIYESDFWILYNGMCQHLKDLYITQWTSIFQMIWYAWVKHQFKVQDRSMDLNVRE